MTQKHNFKFASATEMVDRFNNRSTILIVTSDNKMATCNKYFWVRCRGTGRPVRGNSQPVRQILPKNETFNARNEPILKCA